MKELRRTVCNRDCPDACAMLATVEDGRVTALRGDPDHPVTRGFLCYRTRHFIERAQGAERLQTPLVRRSDGALAPASWDEALALCAERLARIKAESGGAAILSYRSGGSLGLLKHVTDLFFEQWGPVTIKRGDICSGAGDAAQLADFGVEDSHDLFDLLHAQSIILWGKNVHVSSPHTLPVLQLAKERGAHLTLIDPVQHATAALCDDVLRPRPAGDFQLAMAVALLLRDHGFVDPDVATYCDKLDGFWQMAEARSVAAWCRDADVTPAEALRLASRLGEHRPAAILVGWGMVRRAGGGATVRALDALGALSGNLGVRGGGVSYYHARRSAFDLSFVRGEAAAPRTFAEPFLGQEILAAKDPPVRAVWITAANPVAMLPDSRTTAAALHSCELVVVTDTFLTDTAALAHVVLPTTTLFEADDLLGAYGHHYLGSARPVVPPPPGVKSDLEIIQALAAHLGLADLVAGSARAWKERLLKRIAPLGITLDDIEKRPVRNPLAAEVLFADRRFATPTGKVNLLTTPPPAAALAPADPELPLWLLSLSTADAQCSQWTRALSGPALLRVHPQAASGIADGELGRLESRLGALTVRVLHDPTLRPDVAIIPKGGHFRDGRCANALVRAAATDIGEGGALYDERVRLVPSNGAATSDTQPVSPDRAACERP